MASEEKAGREVAHLVEVMARLRTDCPWDRKQTHESLRRYLLEETYECLDAIDKKDFDALKGELGDILLQVVFHAEIAQEDGRFDMGDIAKALTEKLIRRHPHVFADGDAETADDVVDRWETIKANERSEKSDGPTSMLDEVAQSLPALMRAQKLSDRAASVGFDWPDVTPVLDKVEEELSEFREAWEAGDKAGAASEIGDMLFALVNLARQLDVEAEETLRGSNARFDRRFRGMEERLRTDDRNPNDLSLDEWEDLWQSVKEEIGEA